ncbi:MAG TPA: Rieske 2Fe-2S domain-containing protein [Terriglobales bacterium]|jgi:cytochrome b6-f complex iron-sulfur subunit|nr:Rieske 2Fe-2S domain-containing protein [Terriglobales bacterium]
MADESPKNVANGVLGHLPPWPRPALNNSVIGMEQAYRQRKNLPLLTDADIAALKAGEQMPWERGEVSAPAASAAPAAPAASAPPPAPSAITPPPAAASSVGQAISPEIAAIVAAGKKWSRSVVAAEQARRSRKGLPVLNDAEVTALLGEPATPAATAPPPAAAASAARPAAPAAPRPAAAQATVASASARGTEANTYVGTPAVGTSKAAAAGGLASVGPDDSDVNQGRRRFVWSAVAAFLMAWFIAFFRFFLPRTLFEPATSFKIGYPADYGLGVDTKWQQKFRIWVDRTPDRMFVIYARCTHLGCTPDWKPSENKFKCPCHGSGYDSEGINFEGPAPRPMDRAHVDIAPDGQILVDVSRLYQWPKGQPSRFNDPGAYLPV